MKLSSLIPIVGQVIFIILLPVSGTLLLIAYLYKKLVILSAKLSGQEFVTHEKAQSMLYVIDDFSKHPWSVIPIVSEIKGVLTKEQIYRDMEDLLRLNITGSKDTLVYWKLRAYLVQWMGYFWWKQDKSFAFENHVRFIEGNVESPKDICNLVESLVRKPFGRNRPLWDITVVSNSQLSNQKSVVIFRFSHAVMDGLSLLKLNHRLGNSELPSDFPRVITKGSPLVYQATVLGAALLKGVYAYLKIVQDGPDFNPIHKFTKETKHTGVWKCGSVPPISVPKLKEAKRMLKCSFVDMFVSGMTGGLRRFMEIKGTVPNSMKFAIPIPRPNHPDEYPGNHWYPTIQKMPLGTVNLTERLKLMGKLPTGGIAFAAFVDVLFFVLSILPVASYVGQLSKLDGFTAFCSIMFLGEKLPKIFGRQAEMFLYWIPIGRATGCAMTWSAVSSNEYVWVSLLADTGAIPNDSEMNLLAACITEEFENIIETAESLRKKGE